MVNLFVLITVNTEPLVTLMLPKRDQSAARIKKIANALFVLLTRDLFS